MQDVARRVVPVYHRPLPRLTVTFVVYLQLQLQRSDDSFHCEELPLHNLWRIAYVLVTVCPVRTPASLLTLLYWLCGPHYLFNRHFNVHTRQYGLQCFHIHASGRLPSWAQSREFAHSLY